MLKGDPVLVAFGRAVRKRREAKDLTQEALAEKAGLDRTYISDVERGGRNLSISSMVSIAIGLGTTISDLTKGIHE
jgi:transcriptional regulator with XRE-family HTH domain